VVRRPEIVLAAAALIKRHLRKPQSKLKRRRNRPLLRLPLRLKPRSRPKLQLKPRPRLQDPAALTASLITITPVRVTAVRPLPRQYKLLLLIPIPALSTAAPLLRLVRSSIPDLVR